MAGLDVARGVLWGRPARAAVRWSTVPDALDIDLRGDIEKAPPPPPGGFLHSLGEIVKGWGPPILLVLVIRSILFEPFQIPSGSMIPTLQIGDFILVSKFGYGLRVPFTDVEVVPLGEPERGDVVVFIQPPSVSPDKWCWVKRIPRAITFDMIPALPGPDPCSTDFIKRIVGLPGDTIEVKDNILFVNGQKMERTPAGDYTYPDPSHRSYRDPSLRCEEVKSRMYTENLGGVEHPVLQSTDYVQRVSDYGPTPVPEGEYFMMGDNRDNSQDSRFWGMVPRKLIRGKAMFVWLSFDPCEGGVNGLGSVRTDRIGHGLH
jgi:signal peptidase I